jgi:hypothetical protein
MQTLVLLKRDLESHRFGLDSSATVADVMSLLKLWLQMIPQPILNSATLLPTPNAASTNPNPNPSITWQSNPVEAYHTFTSTLNPYEHGATLVLVRLIRRCASAGASEIETGARVVAPLVRSGKWNTSRPGCIHPSNVETVLIGSMLCHPPVKLAGDVIQV